MAYKTLKSWIDDMLSEQDRKCTAFSLMYELASGGTKEVHTLALGNRTWDPETLYTMFKNMGEQHVQDRQGIHTFVVQAFFDGKTIPEKTTTFIVSDGEIKQGGASRVVTEHPTLAGLVAQQMRHVESVLATNTRLVETMAGTWAHERRDMVNELASSRNEVNESFAIIREMMSAQNEREHQMRMETFKYQRATEERAKILGMTPHLLNTISGKEVIPNEVGDSALVDMMAESLNPEDINMLVAMKKIPESAAPIILARMQQARDKKQKLASELKKLPEGDTGNVTSITKAKGQ